MLVRRMNLADTNDVAVLSTQLGYPTTGAEIGQRFTLMAEDPSQAVFVAEAADGSVIGWLQVRSVYSLVSEPFAQLGGLVVDKRVRGQGIGQALMEVAEQWARDREHGRILVFSNTVRTEAHRFYQQLGYQILKTEYLFEKTL